MASSKSQGPGASRAGQALTVSVLLFVVLVTGLFLRLHRLGELPPGMFFDEGYYALDGWRTGDDGHWLIFFPGNNGREPIYIYLLAAAFQAIGASPWTARWVSAMAGLIAVAALYRIATVLFRTDDNEGQVTGVLAALGMALSFWPVLLTRDVFRAVLVLPFSAVAVWLLYRAWRTPTWSAAAWGGVALGACLYTYLSARFLPIAWALFVAIELGLGIRRQGWRATLSGPQARGFLITVVASALVALPLGVYFALNPAAFAQRAGDVSVFAAHPDQPDWQALVDNAVTVGRMFVDAGDANARHNFPGRPAFDLAWALAFWTGLVGCLIRLRQPAFRWLGIWLVTMLGPTLLTGEAPHFLRSIGAMPPAMLIAGVGLGQAHRLLQGIQVIGPTRALVGLVVLGAGWTSTVTANDYFGRWAVLSDLRGWSGFQVANSRAADAVLSRATEADIIIPAVLFHEPPVRFRLEAALQPTSATWQDRQPARAIQLIQPWDIQLGATDGDWIGLWRASDGGWHMSAVTGPASADVGTGTGLEVLADGNRSPEVLIVNGLPDVFADATPGMTVDARLGDTISLLGFDPLPDTTSLASALTVRLYWRNLTWADADYTVSIQLLTVPDGRLVSQLDQNPVERASRTTLWAPGETIIDSYRLPVPGGLEYGKLLVTVGLYRGSTLARLPVLSASGDPLGDGVRLGAVTVSPPDGTELPGGRPMALDAGVPGLIRLDQVAVSNTTVAPGDALTVTFLWEALRPVAQDYTVFVHVLDEAGTLVAQADAQPVSGRMATSLWYPGERVVDAHTVTLPADLLPGDYRLSFGVYDAGSGERLPWQTSSGELLPDQRVMLDGSVDVRVP